MAVSLGSAEGSLDLDISGFVNELKKAEGNVDSFAKNVSSSASGIGSKFKSAGNEAGSGFASRLKSGLSGTDSAFSSVVSAAKSAASKIAQHGKEAGSNFASGLSSGLKGAAVGFAGSAVAAVAGLGGLVTAANETQEDMGKLEAAFTSSGHTAETATTAYRGMVGVLGETDTAVEASNHLAKLTQSTEELSQWNTIATGVYATFGDSLPIEGLTEAANETARVGQVTGPLADALNWAGVSEDEFNKKLAACNSEQERATLITETLNGMYSEAAAKYQEINGPLIEFRQNMSDLQVAASNVGTALMPLANMILSGLTSSLQEGVSYFQNFVPQLTAAMSSGDFSGVGTIVSTLITNLITYISESLPSLVEGGFQMLQGLLQGLVQNVPAIIAALQQVIMSLLNALATYGPSILLSAVTLFGQLLMGLLQMAPQILAALVSLLAQLIANVANWVGQMASNALQAGIQFLSNLIGQVSQVPGQVLSFLSQVISDLATFVSDMASKALQAGQDFFNNIVNEVSKIPGEMLNIGSNIVEGLWNGINNMTSWVIGKIQGFGESVLGGLKSFFGIASPSKLMAEEIGVFLPQGIAAGFDEAAPTAFSSMQTAINKGVSSLDVNPMSEALSTSVREFADDVRVIYEEFALWFSDVNDLIAMYVNGIVNSMSKAVDSTVDAIESARDAISTLKQLQYETKNAKDTASAAISEAQSSQLSGGDTFIFNSPKAINEVEASRQMKRAKQDIAEGF